MQQELDECVSQRYAFSEVKIQTASRLPTDKDAHKDISYAKVRFSELKIETAARLQADAHKVKHTHTHTHTDRQTDRQRERETKVVVPHTTF
jgi:hypothetical protein